jgi:hypothetical protein
MEDGRLIAIGNNNSSDSNRALFLASFCVFCCVFCCVLVVNQEQAVDSSKESEPVVRRK